MLNNPRQRLALVIALAVLVIGGVAFALTRGGGDDEPAATTTSSTTSTTGAPPPTAPLTGLAGDFEGRLERPALVVKVDNVEPSARPQAGINQADVVYEERVEGSVTRFLAVFHSTDAAPIGPVRSGRTSDIGLFSPLNRPYFAWSGANPTFASRLRSAAMEDVGFDRATDAYFREPGRPAPSNLMVESSVELLERPAEGSGPPPPLFRYRDDDTAPAGLEPVTGVRITFGTSAGSAPVEYRWDGTGWERTQAGTPHVDAEGERVRPANVIVQFVDYVPTDTTDQFGDPIPEAETVGSGDAWVLTAGGLVPATWEKTSVDAVTTYTDAAGNPVELTPGRTWVALPPVGGAQKLG